MDSNDSSLYLVRCHSCGIACGGRETAEQAMGEAIGLGWSVIFDQGQDAEWTCRACGEAALERMRALPDAWEPAPWAEWVLLTLALGGVMGLIMMAWSAARIMLP